MKTFRITWLDRGFTQDYVLVQYKCQMKASYGYFTMYSPLYEAIENGSLCLDAGHGKHKFKIEEINLEIKK